MKKKVYKMSNENVVDSWCTELGIDDFSWLGSGDIGDAYSVGDDMVIKITNSQEEFICAHHLLDEDNDYIANIQDMRIYPDGSFAILMEKVDTDGVEDLFYELLSVIEEKDLDFYCASDEDAQHMSEEVFKMWNDILSGIRELRMSGYTDGYSLDIKGDNMGKNSKGNYCLFDQMNKNNLFNNDTGKFKEIEEQLLDRFLIDEDNIKTITVGIDKIIINKESASKSFSDIVNGRYSQSKGPIECMVNSNWDIQVIDGNHRFVQELLLGNEYVDIQIVYDERCGISHQYFTQTEPGEELIINYSDLFLGLESVSDFDTLDATANRLSRYKKFSEKVIDGKESEDLTEMAM